MSEDGDVSQPTDGTSERRDLRRSRDDRVIAGVCGGLGRYLGIDPVLLRIAFVILTVAGGGGVLLYLLGWIVMPEERSGDDVGPTPRPGTGTAGVVVGTGLIALGSILLIDRLVPWFGRVIGPVVLIAIGVAVMVRGSRS